MSEAEPIRFGPSPSPAEAQEPTPAPAWAYLLRCPDGSLYGGWTNDLARRLKAHRSGKESVQSMEHGIPVGNPNIEGVDLSQNFCGKDKA